MKFKIFGLMLAAGIALAACGNDDDAQNNNNSNDNNQTEQSTSSNNTTDDDVNDDADDQNDNDADDQDDQNADSSQQNSNQATTNTDDVKTKPEQAVNTALKSFDGEVTSIEYKQENGQWLYEVNLINGNEEREIKVSDSDNKVINTEKDIDDDNNQEQTLNYNDAIPFEEAVQKAQDETSGDLKQWTLDYDDGQFVYEIELLDQNMEKEVQLDAQSGDVITVDQ